VVILFFEDIVLGTWWYPMIPDALL